MIQGKKTSKFNYDQIAVKNDSAKPFAETINLTNSKKLCICGNYSELKTFECFKCRAKVHYCVKVQINRPQTHSFECLSCLAQAMDLVYEPQKVLLETFYRTENIFERANLITFEFDLKFEDTKFPVDIRGFKGNRIQLIWPMQGQFYLNGSKHPGLSLKPLKSNTNRKNRKQDNFMIDPSLLKEGKNTLTFRIPRLQKSITMEKFKYEQIGIYFLAIYSVKELKDEQVLRMTQKERRWQKFQTIELFKQGDEDVPAQKQKVRLIDPYTGQRIIFPVRGRYCNHLSTVCLKSYVGFQKNSRSWKCPICTSQANSFMNEPYLDMWMYEILNDGSKGQNVFIHPNGTYEWQVMKQVAQVLDSDEDNDSLHEKPAPQLIQQEPIITELENFDLESHSQHQNQPQQIDLVDYEQFQQGQPANNLNDIWQVNQSEQLSSGQIFQVNEPANPQQLSDRYLDQSNPLNAFEPIIEENIEIANQDQQNLSDSDGQLVFPFQNKFVPSSKLQNIKIPEVPIAPEKKETSQAPEIYTKPLQKKPKPNKFDKRPQQNEAKKLPQKLLGPLQVLRSKIVDLKKNQPFQKNQPASANSLSFRTDKPIFPPPPSTPKVQTSERDRFIGDKRMIQRPNFIQSAEGLIKDDRAQSAQNLRHSNFSFGRVPKKNIEFSQQRALKAESKIQFGLSKMFPLPPGSSSTKVLKKQEYRPEKPKTSKIKTLKCTPISHSRFVKEYCRIPIPPMARKMNDDLKKMFGSIL